MFDIIFLSTLALLIVIILFLVYSERANHWVDGYYIGTYKYNKANGLLSSAMYIKGPRLSILLHLPNKLVIQLYKIQYNWTSRNGIKVEEIKTRDQSTRGILGDSVDIDNSDDLLKISKPDCGKILFLGHHLKDVTV